jgi:glycosyltransferase involved in cell wall biosynthesis
VAELVRAGTTGALGAHGDAAALARALEDVLVDPERAARMGQASQKVAAAELSLERMVERLVGLYDELGA